MRQPRNDSRTDKSSQALLEKNFREIVVGNGRSQEPYIIAFHYASDNVSGSPLGTLFGFFEVEIHDQDAAYIVNLLASVAKKEYFANPRRSPVESFEGALHKINVALAEIVKHGNISWLGHLHGAIGVVSRNTLHFSVTGDGEICLAREEGLRSISEGLADIESEPHPLKTFTEVSSGELFDGDLVFALSPSVWSLFSLEDLKRSLNRLGPAGFEQFLRTALVNELPIAAVILLTCAAPVERNKVEENQKLAKRPAINLDNVWSDKPFADAINTSVDASRTKPQPTATVETPQEYTDTKTGHIYVQASSDEAAEENESVWKERWDMFSHAFGVKLRTWNTDLKKNSRRLSKDAALVLGAFGTRLAAGQRSFARRTRSVKRSLESQWQRYQEHRQRRKTATAAEKQRPPETVFQQESETTPPTPAIAQPTKTLTRHLKIATEYVSQGSSRFQPMARQITACISRNGARFTNGAINVFAWTANFWQTLRPKEKWSVIGVAAGILLIGTIALRSGNVAPVVTETPAPPVETPALPVFPPADEPLATLLAGNQLLFPANNSKSVALTTINALSFLVTEKSIINIQTQESTPTPEPIRLAAAMDDLDAIFALGESGSLYLYSIVTKKFEKNSLPLPAGTQIDGLGSYLTYLYVLDQNAGAIYRFPRAEGGFGAPATWSKEPIAAGASDAFAVYENILLSDTSGKPLLFSRGKNTGANFTGTTHPLSADALAFDIQSGDILALDHSQKRIVRWSTTGTLLAQYFHESFGDAETFSVSPDGIKALVSRQGATTAWQIR